MPERLADALEIWGGIECTIARLQDSWRDQSVETGHRERLDDLDLVADLGIRTLRYPILWETVAPHIPEALDWSWHDARLGRLRELGITPIVGLVHHGSGPVYTSLLDPEFPQKLARYAEAIARRYPWIKSFTPVNEPLTTARFSGLYGHWYPHHRDIRSCLRMLVNQCRAVVLSMEAIRRITPDAHLIQTEDLGKTFSTPLLSYQAEHENARRWLTFDLLTGRITPGHALHDYLIANGITAEELVAFVEAPCPPDILGINHYLTSERFLDHRRSMTQGHGTGSNGRHRYADLEAVRAHLPDGSTGPEARLTEAWERYGLPMAVTEVHHGCSRDEQVRWLADVWDAALRVHDTGADIRAVTVWALFGAMDWNSLLTQRHGHYEPGAYDIRAGSPRLTALGTLTKQLAHAGSCDHPVLDSPGWWRRKQRFYRATKDGVAPLPGRPRSLLVIGADSPFGQELLETADHRGLACIALPARALADRGTDWTRILGGHRAWAVVNAWGIDGAPSIDAPDGPESGGDVIELARECARRALPFLTFSFRDCVFSPAEEDRLRSLYPHALVACAGPLFMPSDTDNFVISALREMAQGRSITVPVRRQMAPSYTPDLLHAALDLLIDREQGIQRLTNGGDVSPLDLSRRIAKLAGLDPARVLASPTVPEEVPPSRNEAFCPTMPNLDSALQRYFRDSRIVCHGEANVMAAE
ncbi:family 1 glycosylhydrolase [Terrihabitans sp. B22-R8]|uniref:family 1 glycosylhydrolase n=1 Tax=Terrihabitans sp. B22-R8 TaxID=3425128 RepID=UPI00403C4774